MGYILGIDVGATSLGWCLLNEKDSEMIAIENMGSRIFSDGREAKSKEPLAVARREARGARRRLDRQIRRKENLMKCLIDNHLMPEFESERKELEKENPYEIRARAGKQKVSPNELGRALFHICQRRGFKSNRKSDRKNNDNSNMKVAMKELDEKLKNMTLGQYLYSLQEENPKAQLRVKTSTEKSKNVYNLYPSRQMYVDEVDKILSNQDLSSGLNEKIKDIIFYQRDLHKQEVGICMLEDNERRAPKALVTFQQFRLLSNLNNLEMKDLINGECLSEEQKYIIKTMLETKKEVSFDDIRKKLKLSTNIFFNLEDDRRKKLEGNSTSSVLSSKKAFGEKWFDFDLNTKEEIVAQILDNDEESDLLEYLSKYDLTYEQKNYVANAPLEDSFGSLSLKAMKKIIPFLEQGLTYDKACVEAEYNHSIFEIKTLDNLPYYAQILKKEVMGGSFKKEDEAFPEKYWGKIANPTVHISLNQIRKLVNEIIKNYGKPNEIVIEIARDLKISKKERDSLAKEQTKNTKENEEINKELERLGVSQNYKNRMIYKLWKDLSTDSLKRACPFCGEQIEHNKIFSGEFEVEHLVPFSRSFNDSRSNKVLSCRNCNRVKGNKTPFEAFGDTNDWINILARAEELPQNKQWRFSEDAIAKIKGKEGDIIARMLNDTRYLAVTTKKYLSHICENVRTIPGQLTSIMRDVWGFNSLLGDDNTKNRDDHRHHSIDALVVACTTRSNLQKVSTNSEVAWKQKHKLISGEQLPFIGFKRKDLEDIINNMVISHKQDHKNAKNAIKTGRTIGCLHEDTNYGLIEHNGVQKFVVRKPLIGMEEAKVSDIIDKSIKEELLDRLSQVSDAKEKARVIEDFAREKNVYKVRVGVKKNPETMKGIKNPKTGEVYRYVVTGDNYCAEIYMPNRGKNNGKWYGEIISTFDAHQKDFIPKWRKEEPEAKLIMRLFANDMVAYEKDGEIVICRVKKMTGDVIYLREHNVANRPDEPVIIDGEAIIINGEAIIINGKPKMRKMDDIGEQFKPTTLQQYNARKISVDILGNIFDPKKDKKNDRTDN